jgi:hypothetical protein
LHSAPRVVGLSFCGCFFRLAQTGFVAPPFCFSWLSSQQQNALYAGCWNASHGTSVCVRTSRGPWAADVCASLWFESQLHLQIPAADGRADGNPDEHDFLVSKESCMLMGVCLGSALCVCCRAVLPRSLKHTQYGYGPCHCPCVDGAHGKLVGGVSFAHIICSCGE